MVFSPGKKALYYFLSLGDQLGFLETLPPKLLGTALDEIAQGIMDQQRLVTTIGLMTGLAIAIYVGYNIRGRLMFYGSFKLQYLLRKQLMGYFSIMDAHYYADHETGDLMAVATADINAICMAASRILNQLIASIFMMSFVLVQMMVTVDWRLTLVTVLPLPIAIVVVFYMSRTVRQLFVQARNAFGDFNNTTLESVAGVQVIRAFVQEQNDIQKLRKSANISKEKELKAVKLDAAFGPLFRSVFSFSMILAISVGVYMVYHHQISAGALVTFNIYLGMLRGPLWSAGTVLNGLQRSQAAYDRFEETTCVKLKLEHGKHLKSVEQISEICFQDYSFAYPYSEFNSLQHIDLTIRKGQTIGIVGKTGSGKSTLLTQLLRFYAKGTGTFTINGISVDQLDYVSLRTQLGYVPQEHVLFSKTVKENIALGHIGPVSDKKLLEAIRLADFEKDLPYLKDGLDTLCGEDGTMLSGGQKQRLSIARAFLSDPEVLILDDSLSAVDGKTEATIVENLKRTRQHKTTLIVAHRLSAIRHADLIIVMENGRIVDRGTHDTLLSHRGWYYEQYQNQILTKEEADYETH